MPTVDKSVCELLARFAVAGRAREVAEAFGYWVETGRISAVAVWVLVQPEGALRALYARGIDESVIGWSLLPHDDSPLRRVLREGGDPWVDPLPEELARSGIPHWRLFVVHDRHDNPIGVALCGCPKQEVPPGMDIVLQVFGPALRRACAADSAAVGAQLFEKTVEHVQDGIIVATLDGAYPTYSESLARLTGWSADEVRAHGWTNLVYPDPAVRKETQRAIAALVNGELSKGIVRQLARSDGTEVSTAIWSGIVPHPSGGAPSMLGVFHDVTSERLARRRAVWDESHAQLGRLAGGIAHEFNNLLAAIMGHADILLLSDDDPVISRHAETILRSAERGADLSRQLLAFSGSANTRTEPIRVDDIVTQAVELFRPTLPAGVALDVEPTEGMPPVEADASQLQQVLMNLLNNARDAVGESGCLTVTTCLAPIPEPVRYRSVHAPADGMSMARVRVRDDGPGFSAEALANLFVPFFSGKADGHGVGLPAVRGIVGAHGGAIDVRNDGGGVVDIYLPTSTRPELALDVLTEEAAGQGRRVWVVDDQLAVLEFTRISLESRGFLVTAVSSVVAARDAIAKLDPSEVPELVVLDVVMEDGGGHAVYQAFRDAGIDPRVVWTSGHTPESVTLPAIDARFLQKPFTGADLATVVTAALQRPASSS